MNIFVIGSYVQGYCWNVDWIPKAGETLIASGLNIEHGGKGLNVAVCSKRLGASVNVLFGVGEDAAGDELKKLLLRESISTQYTFPLAKQSGYATGMIAKSGENAIAVFPGPNLLLDKSHISKAEMDINQSDILYAQFEGAYSAIEAGFSYAKTNSVKTILNPSPWQEISTSLLDNTDVIIVNEVEVIYLLNSKLLLLDTSIEEAQVSKLSSLADWQQFLSNHANKLFQRWSGELLVVTLGELGCIAIDSKLICKSAQGYKVKAVDTICCGDAFASGVCLKYLQSTLEETLVFANACGAIVSTKAGMLSTLPTLNEISTFLTKHAARH